MINRIMNVLRKPRSEETPTPEPMPHYMEIADMLFEHDMEKKRRAPDELFREAHYQMET